MKLADLFWCPSCGEVVHRPNNTLHRGICHTHDAIMFRLDNLLTPRRPLQPTKDVAATRG